MRLNWIYLICLIPTITEGLEVGHFPNHPRAALADVLVTLLLVAGARWIRQQADRLAHLSDTDGLTGVCNTRRFYIHYPA